MKKRGSAAAAMLCAVLAAATVIVDAPRPAGLSAASRLSLTRSTSLPEWETASYPELSADDLHGSWSGTFPVKVGKTKDASLVVSDHATINFDSSRNPSFLLSLESNDGTYLPVNDWSFEDNNLVFRFNAAPWQATVRLHLENADTLSGTFSQYGADRAIAMWRDTPEETPSELLTDFMFEGKSEDAWLTQLATYPAYTGSRAPIPFTYDLFDWEKGGAIASAYHLDQLMETTKGYADVDRMKAIMDLICANFKHDGAVPVPKEGLTPQEAVDYCLQNGAIECRGLSSILAEFLRLCNIPAKAVMCIPAIEPSEDCHVVVQAYSYALGRWVLLDPTYHLMLKTPEGSYANLQMLREALINGTDLIPNEDAGHNGMPFSMAYYRAYMAKNTFRFSTATHFSSLDKEVGGQDNRLHMLVPNQWEVPYRWSRPELLTTSADDFWAPPPPRLDWDESIPSIAGAVATDQSDWMMLGGQKYVSGADVYWVSAQMPRMGQELGIIQRSGESALEMTDWDASVLNPGARVYRFLGNDNLIIVLHDGKYTNYYRAAD